MIHIKDLFLKELQSRIDSEKEVLASLQDGTFSADERIRGRIDAFKQSHALFEDVWDKFFEKPSKEDEWKL